MLGALLGGIAMQAGRRSNEAAERERQADDTTFNLLANHFEKNYGNMTPEEQQLMIGRMEKAGRIKTGSLAPLMSQAEAIYHTVPQMKQAQPLGDHMGNVPAAGSPIWAPPTQPIKIGAPPSMSTPNQIQQQRNLALEADRRQQKLGEIDVAPVPDVYKDMMRAQQYGLNVSGYEAAGLRADAAADLANTRGQQIRGTPRLVMRDGRQIPVFHDGNTEFTLETDTQGNQVRIPYTASPTDTKYETPSYSTVAGENDQFAFNRKTGTNAGALKTGVRKGARGSGLGAVMTIDTVDDKGRPVKKVVPKTVGSTYLKAPSATESKEFREYENSARQISDIGQLFKPEYIGAVRGSDAATAMREKFPNLTSAITLGQLPKMKAQEETFHTMNKQLRNNILHLLSGAAVNAHEQVRILAELPDSTISDPKVWQARFAATQRNATSLLNKIRERVGQSAIPLAPLPGQGPTVTGPQEQPPAATGDAGFKVKAPNGKTYSFPSQEAADQFRARIGAQ